jgi:hypothetical protein
LITNASQESHVTVLYLAIVLILQFRQFIAADYTHDDRL